MTERPDRKRDVFRNRAVVGIVVREIVSLTGSQMTWVALPWFVLTTSGSATRMTAVLAVETLAVAAGGFFGGNLATRLGPRRTMLIGDLSRGPLLATIPVLHLAGLLSFPLLLVLVAGVGIFVTPTFASKTVLLADVIGDDEARLSEANTVLQTANRLASILGPPLAGVLIGVFGATEVLFIDAATFGLGALAVLTLVPPQRGHEAPDDGDTGLAAGFRFLVRDPLLRGWSVALILGDVIWLSLFAAMPVLVIDRFGEEPHLVGWIFGGFGIGAVVGNVVCFRIADRVDRMLLVSVGELGMVLPLWLLLMHVPAVALVGVMALSGFANGLVNGPLHTIVLLRAPKHLRTKMWSAVIVATSVLAPVGLIATGPSLERWGVDATVVVLVAVGTLAASILTTTGLRHRASTRAEPAFET